MRRRITILLLLFAACSLLAQDRDSLLRRINAIKLDAGHYLYGLCTLQGDQARQTSRTEALEQLRLAVDAYLQAEQLTFLRSERAPWLDAAARFLSCDLMSDCTRTIAFIAKDRVREMDRALAAEYGNRSRQEAVDSLIRGLRTAGTLAAVFALVEGSTLRGSVTMGQTIDDRTQALADDGFLVYFDPVSDAVLEVMTPLDASFSRKNLATGAVSDPLHYRTAPIWIHIDGLQSYPLL